MPFNSYVFVLLLLPLSMAGFRFASLFGAQFARRWLLVCSIAFYALWSPAFVAILATSIAFNYAIGGAILSPDRGDRQKDWLLAIGVGGNIALLFYAKYLPALLEASFGASAAPFAQSIIVPIGVSFFTFTQIGYLVDCRGGQAAGRSFSDYALFIFFFPCLISGPILRHRELVPQFEDSATYRFRVDSSLAVGMTLFIIGLAKKAAIADDLSTFADHGFSDTSHLRLISAWSAAVCYSLQLYFDFSGYSDMALGIARMFGFRLPLNFNSPYKATSVIDFWQRWHMSLTRFITRYIYNPLAMRAARRRAVQGKPVFSRKTADLGGFSAMVAFPMLLTMILVGVWHGAGWQFLVFGLLHGLYLTINHAWRVFGPLPQRAWRGMRIASLLASWSLTYFAVLIAQVFFRASSAGSAIDLVFGMLGARGIETFGEADAPQVVDVVGLIVLFAIVLTTPNSQQILAKFSPTTTAVEPSRWRWLQWQPNAAYALIAGFVLFFAIGALRQQAPFLYFKF